MAYLIMVILLIASGFLIMFRVKINPQTIVSLQTMIPKLIITMLLVTFSFAIAGLVIDMIYVILVTFSGFLSLNGLVDAPVKLSSFLTTSGFGQYAAAQMLNSVIWAFLISGLFFILGLLAIFTIPGLIAPFMIISAVIGIVFFVFWLIILGRIFIMLIKAYVMLILQICIGPLQIMLDLIPGQKGFSPWLTGIISNASVFVVVPIMFVIQHILSGDISNSFFGLKTITETGNVNLNLPFLNAKLTGWDFIIKWIMGFVVLALTPKIADIVRDALKIPPFKYGSAIGDPLRPFTSLVGSALVGYAGGDDLKGTAVGGAIGGIGQKISRL